MQILASVVGNEWANIISQHTTISLARMKDARSFEDTKGWNTPITLVAHPEFERSIDELQRLST